MESKKEFDASYASKKRSGLKYRLTTMMKFQYHMIARADDLGHFKISDLRSHSNSLHSLFALQIQVFWSKNVIKERKCPNQILLGSMDPRYSVYCCNFLFTWKTGLLFTNHNRRLSSIFLSSNDIDVEHAANRAKES